ncbi:MAG TPA: hypothetical protein PKZ42_14460 [Syntrophales bacterium]|nr:hypothetical protein [Syntrophales bacterium]
MIYYQYKLVLYRLLIEAHTMQDITAMFCRTGVKEYTPLLIIIRLIGEIREKTVERIPRIIPGLARYKISTDLERISELYPIFERLGIQYFICGGVSYSVRLFNLNGDHYHADVDIAILEERISDLFDLARARGWKVSKRDNNVIKFRKETTSVDIFSWKFLDGREVQSTLDDITVTLPITTLSYDTYEGSGQKHRIASIDYAIRTLPFIQKEQSKKMVKKLQGMAQQIN